MKTEDGKIEQAGCAPMPSTQKPGKHKLGDGMSRPSWRLSFLGDPGANFFWKFTGKAHCRSRGGGKSENPDALRDFQVEWESPAFGLFHGTAFSTALVPKDCATEP